MLACPYCKTPVDLKQLSYPAVWRNYRICPHCEGRFTVDPDTRIRQALFIVVALIALVLTMALYYGGRQWLIPALASYVAMAGLLAWGNRKVYLVPYQG